VSQPAAYEPSPGQISLAWQQRDRLMRIARRRTLSEHEAEDAVSEVLLRAAEGVVLDDEALARWLTTVTINVCADIAREHARSGKRAVYTVRQLLPEPSPEQQVLDRETAATAVRRLNRLPSRQREALLLRSAGFGIDEIAELLNVSYKSAESLLSRARAVMRRAVAVVIALLLTSLKGLRRHTRGPAVTAAALVIAVSGTSFFLHPGHDLAPTSPTKSEALSIKFLPPPRLAAPRSTPPRRETATAIAQRGPKPAAQPTGHQTTLVPPARVRAGRATADTPPISYRDTDETFIQTTRRCIAHAEVSTERIGCPR
jgi:RNA polymerase sigma factor (sigma-70 family)